MGMNKPDPRRIRFVRIMEIHESCSFIVQTNTIHGSSDTHQKDLDRILLGIKLSIQAVSMARVIIVMNSLVSHMNPHARDFDQNLKTNKISINKQ